ncbi:hypothetical protein HOG21_00640 [bacterium]|jgi:hypothetical protein|nr:hypothetical protein [bacterium]
MGISDSHINTISDNNFALKYNNTLSTDSDNVMVSWEFDTTNNVTTQY